MSETRPLAPAARRRAGSRRRLAVRRAVALAVVLGVLAAGAWIAWRAVDSAAEESAPPPPPATTAARKPAVKPLRIVFPEGFNRREMAARIAAVNAIAREKRKVSPRLRQARYLALTERLPPPPGFGEVPHLEGFLFPATYDFLPKTTTRQLVDRQLEAFQESWAGVDLAFAKSKNLTPYDVLIIASMIEKETIAPDERPLVASVIYNRLKAGMPLQIDATIRYGLDVPGTEPLRQSHLASDNPYNTRMRLGLPPTPIANPGLASMQAAAHPADTDYLYFVRKPDKVHHFFTASDDEFYAKACEYGYGC